MSNEYLELLNDLKKVVDDYEKIIDLTKIVLNEVRAYGGSEKIRLLSRRLADILKQLEKITSTNILNNVVGKNDNPTFEFINVFSRYIALVSIPYEKDLINEIREELLSSNNIEYVKQVDEILKTINKIEELYSKTISSSLGI